jgi:hypothetical protein
VSELLNDAEEAAKSPSPIDELRQLRQELEDNKSKDLDIPGYNGKLVARYGLMETKQLAKIGKRIQRQFRTRDERVLYASLDTMIASCEGLYYRNDDGDLKPFGENGTPLNFSDPELATMLGFEASTARPIVMGVFGGNDLAVINHCMTLNRWMQNTGAEIDEDLLGE